MTNKRERPKKYADVEIIQQKKTLRCYFIDKKL